MDDHIRRAAIALRCLADPDSITQARRAEGDRSRRVVTAIPATAVFQRLEEVAPIRRGSDWARPDPARDKEILRLRNEGLSMRALAEKFGLDRRSIGRALQRAA